MRSWQVDSQANTPGSNDMANNRDNGRERSVSAKGDVKDVREPMTYLAWALLIAAVFAGIMFATAMYFSETLWFAVCLAAGAFLLILLIPGFGYYLIVQHRDVLLSGADYLQLTERQAAECEKAAALAQSTIMDSVGSNCARALTNGSMITGDGEGADHAAIQAAVTDTLSAKMDEIILLGKVETYRQGFANPQPLDDAGEHRRPEFLAVGRSEPAWVKVDISKRDFHFMQQAITDLTTGLRQETSEADGEPPPSGPPNETDDPDHILSD